jgi:hypothetical protein
MRKFEWMVLGAALALWVVGCGNDAPGAMVPDAAMAPVDAGSGGPGANDAGSGASDAGSGGGARDAGAPPSQDAGSGGAGACLNEPDTAVLASGVVEEAVGTCAQTSFGREPQLSMCIQERTALSDGCTACFAQSVQCIFANCTFECVGGASAPGCVMCRRMNCDPAFIACSGLTPP